jgi:predicted ATP-dependent endonuclease of OLD family
MLYAASPALTKAGNIVLIDEPEISLHIDWQRKLLRKMQQQLGERQIIVCTHSPEIGGDHLEAFQEIELIPSSYQDIASKLVEIGLNDKEDVDEEPL